MEDEHFRKHETILQVITRLDPGGSSEVFTEWVTGLRRQGYRVTAAFGSSPVEDKSLIAELEKQSVECVRIPGLRRVPEPFSDITALLSIVGVIIRVKPDIVHLHTSKAGLLGRLAVRLAGSFSCRTVFTPHGHIFHGYFGRFWVRIFQVLERIGMLFTDSITFLTSDEQKAFEKYVMGAGRRPLTRVLPCGIDGSGEREILVRPLRRVVFAGRFEPIKGPDIFVDAALKLGGKMGLRFVLFGEGSLREKLIYRAAGVESIEFRPFAPIEKVIEEADILVVPSRNEGLGRVNLYAGLAGVPVIGSDAGGIPEILDYGRAGLLFESGNCADLVRKIVWAVENPEETFRRAEILQTRVKDLYLLDKTLDQLRELYDGL